MNQEKTYRVESRYQMIFAICLILSILFAWSFWQTPTPATGFFIVVCLAIAIWHGQISLSYVTITENTISLHSFPHRVQKVEFRQLIEVSENGRLVQVMLLLYYPLLANGLVDLEDAQALLLPRVVDQEVLLEVLQANTPS